MLKSYVFFNSYDDNFYFFASNKSSKAVRIQYMKNIGE